MGAQVLDSLQWLAISPDEFHSFYLKTQYTDKNTRVMLRIGFLIRY